MHLFILVLLLYLYNCIHNIYPSGLTISLKYNVLPKHAIRFLVKIYRLFPNGLLSNFYITIRNTMGIPSHVSLNNIPCTYAINSKDFKYVFLIQLQLQCIPLLIIYQTTSRVMHIFLSRISFIS